MAQKKQTDLNEEKEHYPLEPNYHPVNRVARLLYDYLASSKLAMALLVAILAACLLGVTVYRGPRASELVFGTLWFNALLVLLVVNTACCFFGRMWGRRITVVSFGMILFHLSFVAMFVAIVFNSLFYFQGLLRITEGETLSNRDPGSYDSARHGLFFSYARLKGETTLSKVYRGYKVDGNEKDIAYDVAVAEGQETSSGTIYITNKFAYKGVEYIRDREGYSLLVVADDRQGKELYGMHIPLQSLMQPGGKFLYTTGTMYAPGSVNFPPGEKPYFALRCDYTPDPSQDRSGTVRLEVRPPLPEETGHPMGLPPGGHPGGALPQGAMPGGGAGQGGEGMPHGASGSGAATGAAAPPLAQGSVRIGEPFSFDGYRLRVPEVRYWVGMNVSYNPGKPFVLASLCIGLAGLMVTTVGRMLRGGKRS